MSCECFRISCFQGKQLEIYLGSCHISGWIIEETFRWACREIAAKISLLHSVENVSCFLVQILLWYLNAQVSVNWKKHLNKTQFLMFCLNSSFFLQMYRAMTLFICCKVSCSLIQRALFKLNKIILRKCSSR